jgi:hypothetical protein
LHIDNISDIKENELKNEVKYELRTGEVKFANFLIIFLHVFNKINNVNIKEAKRQ